MNPLTIAVHGSEHTPLDIVGKMANRHGLIAGATGTGKTVTLRKMAESFSRIGVPVFLADVKGDLSGLCGAGSDWPNSVWTKRPIYKASPCAFGTCTVKAASPCA